MFERDRGGQGERSEEPSRDLFVKTVHTSTYNHTVGSASFCSCCFAYLLFRILFYNIFLSPSPPISTHLSIHFYAAKSKWGFSLYKTSNQQYKTGFSFVSDAAFVCMCECEWVSYHFLYSLSVISCCLFFCFFFCLLFVGFSQARLS